VTVRGDRYVIAELIGGGHRFWYVSLMLRWLADNDASADISLVTTRSAQGLPEWDEYIASSPRIGQLNVVLVESAQASINVIAVMLQTPNTKLVIPDGDRWLGVLLAATIKCRFRPKGTLLIMRPFRARGIHGTLRYLGKLALMKSLAVLAPNLSVLRLAPRGTRMFDPGWVNDPVEFNPLDVARAAWYEGHGLAADRQYLVVLGELSHRKFVPDLLEAFSDEQIGNWHLLLVGTLDTQERALVGARPASAQYSVFEGFASDRDFDTWIAQADAVAILHRNEGSSGIMAKCAVAGVPIMVGGAPSLLDAARAIEIPRRELLRVGAHTISEALPSLPFRTDLNPGITGGTDSKLFVTRLIGRSV
jgi:hypothetical protein